MKRGDERRMMLSLTRNTSEMPPGRRNPGLATPSEAPPSCERRALTPRLCPGARPSTAHRKCAGPGTARIQRARQRQLDAKLAKTIFSFQARMLQTPLACPAICVGTSFCILPGLWTNDSLASACMTLCPSSGLLPALPGGSPRLRAALGVSAQDPRDGRRLAGGCLGAGIRGSANVRIVPMALTKAQRSGTDSAYQILDKVHDAWEGNIRCPST